MDKPKPAKPVTAQWLMNAAQYYLARYAASEAGLVAVLRRKASKRAGVPPGDDALALIAATVAKLRSSGLIDDHAFATARARSLQRKGLSAGGARIRLAAKGIERDVADEAIAETGFDETAQVLATARRLRIAAFAEAGAALSDRDKARLARRGFGPGAIRKALEAAREQDLS